MPTSSIVRSALLVAGTSVASEGVGAGERHSSPLIRGSQVGIGLPLALGKVVAELAGDLADDSSLSVSPEEVRSAAYEDGFREGYGVGHREGLAAAEDQTRESVERLMALVASVQEQHGEFYRRAEEDVVQLALAIAAKVIERTVEQVPDLVQDVIKAALDEMDTRTVVRVRVNPMDEELLRRQWDQLVPVRVASGQVELVADPRVREGGAIIETTQGQVDAQLQTKVAQLGHALAFFTTSGAEVSLLEDA